MEICDEKLDESGSGIRNPIRDPGGLSGQVRTKFPAHYFGNAIGGRMMTMKVKDLVAEGSLGRVAVEVNKVVTKTTEEKLKEAVENWIKSPDIRGLGGFAEDDLLLNGSPEI